MSAKRRTIVVSCIECTLCGLVLSAMSDDGVHQAFMDHLEHAH